MFALSGVVKSKRAVNQISPEFVLAYHSLLRAFPGCVRASIVPARPISLHFKSLRFHKNAKAAESQPAALLDMWLAPRVIPFRRPRLTAREIAII
jgi:hypothetical protein